MPLTGGNNPCPNCGKWGFHDLYECINDPRGKVNMRDHFAAAALSGLLIAGVKGDIVGEALRMGWEAGERRQDVYTELSKKSIAEAQAKATAKGNEKPKAA